MDSNAAPPPVPKKNPLVHSWFSPGPAIHSVFKHQGENWMHRMLILRGMLSVLAWRAPYWVQNAPEFLEVAILVFIVGPVGGLFFAYLYSAVLGMFIRGIDKINVPNQSLRIGIAWSNLPVMAGTLAFVIIAFALFPERLPLPKPPVDYNSVTIGLIFMSAGFLWTMILRAKMISEISVITPLRAGIYSLSALILTDLPIAGMVYLYASIMTQILNFQG